jgi:hypothetical protein
LARLRLVLEVVDSCGLNRGPMMGSLSPSMRQLRPVRSRTSASPPLAKLGAATRGRGTSSRGVRNHTQRLITQANLANGQLFTIAAL